MLDKICCNYCQMHGNMVLLTGMKKMIKKHPTITICIWVLLLAGLLIAAQKALSTDGAVQVVVTVDGKNYGAYSLKREQVIRIETEYGYNELTIKDGKAGVTASDCKNQVCVHSMAISQNGQSIICLPHKLIVQITGSGGKQLDAVVN